MRVGTDRWQRLVGFRWSRTTTYARLRGAPGRLRGQDPEQSEGVTPVKAARIRRVTAAWLRAYRVGWCEIRFDVLAVLCPQGGPVTVEHVQGAF